MEESVLYNLVVTAANNGNPISDAVIGGGVYWVTNPESSAQGQYQVICDEGVSFSVSCSGYSTAYLVAGADWDIQVSLAWTAAWPATQTY